MILWNSVVRLFGRIPEDFFTVGVKAKVEEPHVLHKLLGLVELTVTTEEGLDEFNTGILAEASLLALSGLEHRGFTSLEKGAELLSETLTGLDELLNEVTVIGSTDSADGLLSSLHLTGELDQKKPHLAGHVRDGSGRTLVVDGPVIDPLAQTVGIKDTTEE